mmetsp:Transcript_13671/g.33525  ORF Transcript_13671/g.33525 Transcript_13671/m.33525 type:complete len:155 (-) Transcript_13671:146-610(-)
MDWGACWLDSLNCSCARKQDDKLPGHAAGKPPLQKKASFRGRPEPQTQPPRPAGIGIVFKEAPNVGLRVHSIVQGGAAEKSGEIQEGDILVLIEGRKVTEMSDDEIGKSLLGTEGTAVRVGLNRGGVVHHMQLARSHPYGYGRPSPKGRTAPAQ